jgi:hypothetical protein
VKRIWRWLKDHRYAIAMGLLALGMAATLLIQQGTIWTLRAEAHRNDDQDQVDRDRTVQVEEITARQEADRQRAVQSSCERGNEIREGLAAHAAWVAEILQRLRDLTPGESDVQRAIDEALAHRPPPPAPIPDCSTVPGGS